MFEYSCGHGPSVLDVDNHGIRMLLQGSSSSIYLFLLLVILAISGKGDEAIFLLYDIVPYLINLFFIEYE